jgi:hypothetical protein
MSSRDGDVASCLKARQIHDRRRILPTYRIPAVVRAIPVRWAVLGSNQ